MRQFFISPEILIFNISLELESVLLLHKLLFAHNDRILNLLQSLMSLSSLLLNLFFLVRFHSFQSCSLFIQVSQLLSLENHLCFNQLLLLDHNVDSNKIFKFFHWLCFNLCHDILGEGINVITRLIIQVSSLGINKLLSLLMCIFFKFVKLAGEVIQLG